MSEVITDLVTGDELDSFSFDWAIADFVNDRHRKRMAEVIAERDRLRAELHERTSEVDRLDHLQAKSQAEIERLKLDVAMMNGRLQERTEMMLERQKAWSDRARKAEAVLGRVLPELKAAWPVVEDAEQDALQKGNLQRQAGSLVEAKRWDIVGSAFMDQAQRIRGLIDEIEGLLGGETSGGSDESDKSDGAEQQEGGAA